MQSSRTTPTLKAPQHIEEGRLRAFDRVIANPPFSQNYARKGMAFPERFHTFMPESGKKADLMFVQHMVASLKDGGRCAVVMPHGVLFRGGEEKACRQKFIEQGLLEAVIGLPPGLFYGTGIPACVLVLNRAGSASRDSVLFINADREYAEGKNQNRLRPEDNEKIVHVYRNMLNERAYSRQVSKAELAAEGYNLNIRRYVDNSPAPEPHDVRAHLHGGVPLAEIDAMAAHWDNYTGLRDRLFVARDAAYADFHPELTERRQIKPRIETDAGSGIRRMFVTQRNRFFPLPDYLIDREKQRVEARIPGRLIDERYTFALIQHPGLSLHEVILLDRVQKKAEITVEEAKLLKRSHLIEGRAPNYFVSAEVAKAIGEQAQYTRNKGLDKAFYKQPVLSHLKDYPKASRQSIDELLLSKLPEVLDEKQKLNRVKNLLAEMGREGLILAEGRGPTACWSLKSPIE